MELWIVIYILFIHYIADFIFQTNWMALNKSKNNLALLSHVATYSMILFIGLSLYFGPDYNVFLLVLANGFAHFLTDYITSRMNAYFWINEKRSFFWWTIGLDQWIHASTLITLSKWLLFSNLTT
jgi:hypothetical protein